MNNTQIEKIKEKFYKDFVTKDTDSHKFCPGCCDGYTHLDTHDPDVIWDFFEKEIQENYVRVEKLEEIKLEVSFVIGNRSLDRTTALVLMKVGSIFDRYLSKTQEEGGKQE